jgi:hypothetical protein
MEALIGLLLLLLFSFLAYRYGYNSLPGIGSQGEPPASDVFPVDRDTHTVGSDDPEPHPLTTLSPAGGAPAITSRAA